MVLPSRRTYTLLDTHARDAYRAPRHAWGGKGAPEGGTYACTAVTDTWLDLLQLAFCAMRRLPRAVPDLASSRRATAELDAKPGNAAAGSRRATAELDVRLGNALASYSGALQDLLRQLLQHWKVAIPV